MVSFRNWLAICLLAICGWAQAAQDQLASLPHGSLPLTPYLSVLEDPTQSLTLEQVRQAAFRPAGQGDDALSFGYTSSAYWLRLELGNHGEQALARVLEISNARLSSIRLYVQGPDGTHALPETGSAQPYATRPSRNRYFAFPLQLAPHADYVIYIRVASSGAKLIPAKLWTPAAYQDYAAKDYLLQGAYFGGAAAMVLFNLVLFVTLRDRLYLLYIGFALFASLALAGQNGLAHEWLWPGLGGAWPNLSASLCFSLSAAFFVAFMRAMLATRRLIPRLDKLLLLLLAVFIATPVFMLFFYRYMAGPVTTFWAAASPTVLVICLVCVYKRQRSAYYFAAAFITLFIGNTTSSLAALGVMPHNMLSNYGTQLGSACEMMMLAFALADRVHVMRREKEQAHTALLAALQSSERQLEERVARRTEELHAANEKLAALSMTDGLTGIANRRCFDEILATEWTRASRLGHALAVGLIDVDHFKQYNDHFGHQQGDECLRSVARALESQVQRAGDLVARYGGEEFAFIVPATDEAQALAVAERIRKAIAQLRMPHPQTAAGYVTASVGVAAAMAGTGSRDQLLRTADQALYRAKRAGRNRVEGALQAA
ncbi:diguanylate cyclase [Oxalobacteraceae bacterium A2-2]